jgi:tight adherence protein B
VKRRLIIVLAAALSAAASLAASSAAAPVQVTESGSAHFPDRAYVLTLGSGQRLVASQVRVRENGLPVASVTVEPIGGAHDTSFGTVLAIDASDSMAGKPIREAVKATQAFAARRSPNQRLALVSFNKVTDLLLPFTTSQAVVDRALAHQPSLASGTHIFDAVARAIGLIQGAHLASGAVVVLSDGADTGSSTTLDDLTKQARDAHVRVFTVGLRSRAFRPQALERLASGTGGSFSKASAPSDLARIYDQLGLELANQYVVKYRSLAKPSRRVHVAIRVVGVGQTRAAYVTPALALPKPSAFHRRLLDRIWQSPLTMVAVTLLVAALFAFGLFLALRPKGGSLRKRMSDFVSIAGPGRRVGSSAIANRIFVGTERSLERTRWWTRFKETLELAEIKTPPAQVVVGTLILTVAITWFLAAVIAAPLVIIGLCVPLVVRAYINQKVERKRKAFADQLPDNLDVLASGLRAGHSLVGALAVVVNDAPEPSHTEFQRVIADEQLGVPFEDALGVVVERMNNRNLEQVALVASLQREAGGNSAEVLERVTENIRERMELRRLVHTLTAQARFSRWIVSLLPVALLLLISLLNRPYISPLFTHTSGRIALACAGVMVITGSLVIKRIANIRI